MDVMIMPNNTLNKPPDILERIKTDFPDITFEKTARFSWHANTKHITYRNIAGDEKGLWALLHELGHALLEHTDFLSDVELLNKEVAAWAKAHELAARYDVTIDQDYIENNLDSYRDWLHVRATCPTCHERCLQLDKHTYTCLNCHTQWHVTRSRLCRPYRRQTK